MNAIVFLGIQGSGKGTQAKVLAERLNYQHVNIGDLFRMHTAGKTELGNKVKAVIERGELVSDELVFEVISGSIRPDALGIVFDGFPRTAVQAEYLVEHYHVTDVIYLDLSEEDALKRMTSRRNCPSCKATYNTISAPPLKEGICDICGTRLEQRADDTPDAISLRFKEFFAQTYGLIDFFEQRRILRRVSAEGSIEDIAASINEILKKA
ncbi:MAG TPA: nucleoside monophosphate kinase [Candidatus Cloacimonadota bacterium]|nr:nucleoside monophosphate kinase [Candidatus Cloacimonadota bacterium]HPS39000.1 nucleoside monophosphate kinase [Candidatus Cloacimonadota bacterium]